jgi:medium-chain acyl-[acyl-carrier-protein] hydrolase
MSVRLKCLEARPMATQRILLVPYAGAGMGAFRGWAKEVSAQAEPYVLQLPGREDRLREPPYRSWPAMLRAATEALGAWPSLPVSIFGHSLGAVIALELARWLNVQRPGKLRHLFVAGRPWPGAPTAERRDLVSLGDDDFLAAMDQQYGSMSSSLSIPEVRDLTLPALRADLCLLDSYRYADAVTLNCPLTASGGTGDPMTDAASLSDWRRETSGAFKMHWVQAGHFFVESHRSEVLV